MPAVPPRSVYAEPVAAENAYGSPEIHPPAGIPRAPRLPFWAKSPAGVFIQVGEPGPWERVTLAGIELPGYCAVRSSKARKAITVAGPGADKEEIFDLGAESPGISIVSYMWTEMHLAQYEQLVEAIEMKGGTRARRQAVDIVHPGLNLLDIASVYVTLVTVPEPASVRGVYEFSIQAQEFAPEVKRQKAPKAAGGKQVIHVESSLSSIPTAINTTPATAPATPSTTEVDP
jgi:DNA circularisation protein N-terminus